MRLQLKFSDIKKMFFIGILLVTSISCSQEEPLKPSNLLPSALFSIGSEFIYVGDKVIFTDRSTDLDGKVVDWLWDFGDGTKSTEVNPTHVFEVAGEYTVVLTVKDDKDGIDKESLTINVEAQPLGSVRIKIMTFNIHRGVSSSDVYDLDAIAAVINRYNPDYVALQEVDYFTDRNKKEDIAMILGQKTNMNHVFGKAIDYQGGEFGNAILTRRDIESDDVLTIPSVNEKRSALRIRSKPDDNSRVFNFISTHLDYGDDTASKNARKESATILNKNFANDPNTPSIIAGDFNAIPSSECIRIFKEKWQFSDTMNKFTFPSKKPTIKIDYIAFYPQSSWKIVNVSVIENTLESDHNPILITIDLINK